MATKELKTTPKISVKIWRPILDKFDEKLESACLRRDAFLSMLLKGEVEMLDQEVSIPNSQESYDYVFRELDKFDRKLVSLALPSEISARLNEVCATKRIVRDAFFNRLFLLLAAKKELIDKLVFGAATDEWRREVWREVKYDEKFFQDSFYPLGSILDPFWAIRMGIDLYAEGTELEDHFEPSTRMTVKVRRYFVADAIEPAASLYTTVFHQKSSSNLLAFSCYLPDWEIPGHPAEQASRLLLDDLLEDEEAL